MNQSSKTAELLPNASNLAFVERLYEDYLRDPSSVPPDWQRYFADLGNGELRFPKPRFAPSFLPFSLFNPPAAPRRGVPGRVAAPELASLQDRVYMLIRLYRVRGH